MALPPIISNLPIIKLFRPQGADGQKHDSASAKSADKAADSVNISAAAARALKLSGVAQIEDPAAARATAAETRGLLERTGASLGLDPQFG